MLTGRFSLFRIEAVADPGFIAAIARDSIEHWRLGRIPMVTGDDKSSWFALLKADWRMLYVPDVAVGCAEALPAGTWFGATSALMARWYGNAARNNDRALALGCRRIGSFVWLCVLDQRISPWTTLAGPSVVAMASLTGGHVLVIAYGLWILATRSLIALLDGIVNGRFHPIFPLLLYYNQCVGAVIKIFAQFNPDRQRWNRQGLKAQGGAINARRLISMGYMGVSLVGFVLLVSTLAGHLDAPSTRGRPLGLRSLLDDRHRPDAHLRVECGSLRASPCAVVNGVAAHPRSTTQ